MSIIDKLRKSRQSRVEVNGVALILRRPTDLEWFEMRGSIDTRRLLAFVDGWDGVTEGHIIIGGDPHPLPFDRDLCVAWLEDSPDLMGVAVNGVIEVQQQIAHQGVSRQLGRVDGGIGFAFSKMNELP